MWLVENQKLRRGVTRVAGGLVLLDSSGLGQRSASCSPQAACGPQPGFVLLTS